MRLRYMLEYTLLDRDANPRYEPIGVWVQGPGPGLDIIMEFLPGNDEAQEEADWVINRLVENDVKSLMDGFLEYHRATMSPYRGMRGEIVETEDYQKAEECAKAVCRLIPHLSRTRQNSVERSGHLTPTKPLPATAHWKA